MSSEIVSYKHDWILDVDFRDIKYDYLDIIFEVIFDVSTISSIVTLFGIFFSGYHFEF